MTFSESKIKGAFVIGTSPTKDDRGAFTRLYCERQLMAVDHNNRIVQVNHSMTRESGTIRGMHFQNPPDAEVKIIRCLKGSVYDVVIDLRTGSDTFLSWYGVELSFENGFMNYIPEGCAHGFQSLEDNTELLYLHTAFYNKENEGGVRFDDPKFSISWPLSATHVSKK